MKFIAGRLRGQEKAKWENLWDLIKVEQRHMLFFSTLVGIEELIITLVAHINDH